MRKKFFRRYYFIFLSIFFSGIIIQAAVHSSDAGERPQIREEEDTIVFEGKWYRYVLGKDGINKEFIDTRTGIDYLNHENTSRIFHVLRNNLSYGSTEIDYENGVLTARLSTSGILIKCRVEVHDGYFTFELVESNAESMDTFTLVHLPVTLDEHVGKIINVCHNEQFGIGVLALNIRTRCLMTQADLPVLEASGESFTGGLTGIKAAVLAAPADSILHTIGQMEKYEGIPHPEIDGVWAKISPGTKKSNLTIDCNEHNVEKVIQYAQEGGFECIIIEMEEWAESAGTYTVNKKNFPRGLDGLRTVVSKIHSAGLKAGTKFLVGCIGKDDPYVSPNPDPRLFKLRSRTLAREISPQDTTIYSTYSLVQFPLMEPFAPKEMDIQIENEIISYSGLVPEGYNPRFTGCGRGLHNTGANSHKSGEKIFHLAQRRDYYIIDPNTSLADEVSERISGVVEGAGLDLVILDGEEFISVHDPLWYFEALIMNKVCAKLPEGVLIQSGNVPHFNWHYISRYEEGTLHSFGSSGTGEGRINGGVGKAADNFISAQAGVWEISIDNISENSINRDFFETAGAKCIGFNVPFSLRATVSTLDGFGRTHRILDLVRIYEDLRRREYFSENVKSMLRKPGGDYTIQKDGLDHWKFVSVTRFTRDIDVNPESTPAEWKIHNPYGSQPAELRITALPARAAYEDKDNIVLTDFQPRGYFQMTSAEPEFTSMLSASTELIKEGQFSGRLTGYNSKRQRSLWSAQTMKFPVPLNLGRNRSLGVWVFGDGSGAVLNIGLGDDREARFKDHLIRLDYTGWKYIEFFRSASADLFNLQWPYPPSGGYNDFNYGQVMYLSLFLNDVPSSSRATIHLSPIKALKESFTSLVNPSITIGNRTITIPLTLEPYYYLEYKPNGVVTMFSPEGYSVSTIRLPGAPPVVKGGDTAVSFSSTTLTGGPGRCKVTMILKGDALKD